MPRRTCSAKLSAAVHETLEPRLMLSVNVTTYHYDNARDGANTAETALTYSNVNSKTFGKVASLPVDGQIYTQPLVLTGVAVPGQGTHDLVLVATEADDVYAFDAKGNDPAKGYLWRTSLLQSGETTIPESDYGTTDITPQIGVTGTPVIDPATGTLYVVGAFKEADGTYRQRLYALDVKTGASKFGGPVLISASVTGTGVGSSNGKIAFDAFRENQRPALTLANGQVYVGWASHGDQDPWHGWVIAYNAATLKQSYVYNDTPDGDAGGIWMSGGGIAVDASGDLYFTNGNGTFDGDTGGPDLGMAVEKLSSSLKVEDYFSPYNESDLSDNDLDYGCSSVVLLPTQTGSAPDEILTESKWGTMFLNNGATGKLGEFTADGPNNDLGEAEITPDDDTSNMHNTISYWDGHAFVCGDALPVQSFSVGGGKLGTTPTSVSNHVFGSTSDEDGQGCGPTVSSNGTSNGIVWAVDNSGFTTGPATLYAYKATDLSQMLYNSNQAANGRDTAGPAVKFQDAVVANGYVYVGGADSVTVYGLISASTAFPTVKTPAAASPATVTGTTTTLGVTATDPAADLAPTYLWAASAVPTGAATPTFSVNASNAAGRPTVTFFRAGKYTFTVTISDPNSQLTRTSSVTVTVNQTPTGVTISPGSVTVPNGGTTQFSATADDQFGDALASQPKFNWVVDPFGAGGTITPGGLYTAPASGADRDTIKATSGSVSAQAVVIVAVPSATVRVDLDDSFNKVGIVLDGTTFGGGIDDVGSALSGNLLDTSVNWDDSTFTVGGISAGNAVDNVVTDTNQSIPLSPQGRYATLKFLALHLNGDAADLNLAVNYTDGTSQPITQSFSDWFTPQDYPNESAAVTMPYRDLYTGARDNRTFTLYGYSFDLNPTKTIKSLTLPADDPNFDLLAIDLLGVAVTKPASATSATTTTAKLSVTGAVPAGDAGPIYTWAVTTLPAGATRPTFSPNGTASAGNTSVTFHQAGTYTFTATLTDPTSGAAATSSVTVVVKQTLTEITVSPAAPGNLPVGGSVQFSAAAVDQFGNSLASQPSFAWSVTGVGSVSGTGLYHASAAGTATVRATSGAVGGLATVHVTAAPAWLAAGSAATWNSSTHVLTVTGPATIIADPGTDQPVVDATGSAAVITFDPVATLQIHLGGLSLLDGASAVVASLGTARTAANHRVLVLGQPGATAAPPLTIDATSRLNLADNDLIDHGGNLAAISRLLKSGYNAGNGYWNGFGISSSTATAAAFTALGSGTVLAPGKVDNEPVTTADVEIKYTYQGDANLDGKVDAGDFTLVDNGFHKKLTGWYDGDFDYSGVVDGGDYTLIGTAFKKKGATL